MIALLLLLTTQVAPEIVVAGKRLDDAYRECVQQTCPPLRDAQVSIACAERQFREGAYVKARNTLAAAASRNKRNAATAPKPLAAIYEAYATVSRHDGDMDAFRTAVGRQVRVLRDNLPPDDPAVLAAAFATGDMWAQLGNARSAELSYHAVERQALQHGNTILALQAVLRRVGLANAHGDTAGAARLMTEAEARPDASDPTLRTAMQVVRLRLAAKRADDGQVDRLVRAIGHDASTRPVLIWAPPYKPTAEMAAKINTAKFDVIDPIPTRPSDYGPIQWVDIGFWIRPDGRTSEPEILRGSRSMGWAKDLLSQISGRRYTGNAANAGDPGTYLIDRFTLRGTYFVPTGSLVRRRAGPAELQVLDLTEPEKSVTAHR